MTKNNASVNIGLIISIVLLVILLIVLVTCQEKFSTKGESTEPKDIVEESGTKDVEVVEEPVVEHLRSVRNVPKLRKVRRNAPRRAAKRNVRKR